MAVKIRLKKIGRRHYPIYRIAVMDGRCPRNGKVIENIGTYDPHLSNDQKVHVNSERAAYWLSVGAQPNPTAKQLLKRAGVTKSGIKKTEKKETPTQEKKTEEKAPAEKSEAASEKQGAEA